MPLSNGLGDSKSPSLTIRLEYNENSSFLSLHILTLTNLHLLGQGQLQRVLQVYLVNQNIENRSKHSIDLNIMDSKKDLSLDRKLKFIVTLKQIPKTLFKVCVS